MREGKLVTPEMMAAGGDVGAHVEAVLRNARYIVQAKAPAEDVLPGEHRCVVEVRPYTTRFPGPRWSVYEATVHVYLLGSSNWTENHPDTRIVWGILDALQADPHCRLAHWAGDANGSLQAGSRHTMFPSRVFVGRAFE